MSKSASGPRENRRKQGSCGVSAWYQFVLPLPGESLFFCRDQSCLSIFAIEINRTNGFEAVGGK